MSSRLSAKEKLRIQFRKDLRKAYPINAELDPAVPAIILSAVEPEESFFVRVDSTKGDHYWFSDRRLLRESGDGVHELFRYEGVLKAHWMFKDLRRTLLDSENWPGLKSKHFDRLEIELHDRLVVLEGLGQAYGTVLNFFWWIAPRHSDDI